MIKLLILFPCCYAYGNFASTISKLNGLRADVETYERSIKTLLNEKRRTQDPKTLRAIMAELVVKYNEMEEAVAAYEKIRARTKIKYPTHREQLKRYHPRYRFRPLDQMMKEDGVPEMLDKLNVFMENQFGESKIGIQVSSESKGNISGEMKAYQIQLQKQQSGVGDWSDRPVIER